MSTRSGICFEAVSKSFGPKQILRDFDLQIKRGEILFILGRSGMGKSVTLKHIVGLLKPDRGSVWVDDFAVSNLSEESLGPVRRMCGMVFQHPALFDSMTVFDNIAFGLKTRGDSAASIKARVHECADLVDLPHSALAQHPIHLSYGMQKRASLARTLAPGPEFLLFDEPTTGLDPVTTQTINQLIASLSRKLKVTSVVVSHDMGCALAIADRVLVLDNAQVLALGTIKQIKESSDPLVKDFLAESV